MSGLMLADKTAGLEDKVRELETEAAKVRAEMEMLQGQPKPDPVRVEVPVIPSAITDTLAEIAARAEALAEQVDVLAGRIDDVDVDARGRGAAGSQRSTRQGDARCHRDVAHVQGSGDDDVLDGRDQARGAGRYRRVEDHVGDDRFDR